MRGALTRVLYFAFGLWTAALLVEIYEPVGLLYMPIVMLSVLAILLVVHELQA